MIEVTDQNELAKQLKTHRKIVALFYASWCPFCRSFITVFNKHARNTETLSYIKVKIDEDENPLWEEYSLESVPSLILFENGNASKRLDCELGEGLTEKQFINWVKTL